MIAEVVEARSTRPSERIVVTPLARTAKRCERRDVTATQLTVSVKRIDATMHMAPHVTCVRNTQTHINHTCRHYADTPALHAESSPVALALLARVCRPRRLFLLASLTYKSFSLVFPSACALLAWHDIMP